MRTTFLLFFTLAFFQQIKAQQTCGDLIPPLTDLMEYYSTHSYMGFAVSQQLQSLKYLTMTENSANSLSNNFVALDSVFVLNTNPNIPYNVYMTYKYTNGLCVSSFESDNESGTYVFINREDYTYNSAKKIIEIKSSVWNEDEWTESSKKVFNYDAQNNLTSVVTQELVGATYQNSVKTEFTYDASGKLTQFTNLAYDNNNWVNQTRSDFTYNAAGQLVQTITNVWTNNAFKPLFKIENTYDASGNLLTLINSDNIAAGSNPNWTLSSKTENTYASNNDRTLTQFFIRSGNNWVVASKTEFEYDNSKTYDQLFLPLHLQDKEQFNHQLVKASRFAAASGGTWTPRAVVSYFYSANQTSTQDKQTLEAMVFPNPVEDRVFIQTESLEPVRLIITNSTGRIVLSEQFVQTTTLQIADLPRGFYMYQLTSGNSSKAGVLIKE